MGNTTLEQNKNDIQIDIRIYIRYTNVYTEQKFDIQMYIQEKICIYKMIYKNLKKGIDIYVYWSYNVYTK